MTQIDLRKLIQKHEGLRHMPYTDTVGKVTIGIGRNLTDRGLSDEEIEYLFENDLAIARNICQLLVPNWEALDDVRQAVLIDMAFNLGYNKLAQFKNTLAAVGCGDFTKAAWQMKQSLWAKQVPARAEELAQMMRSGEPPTL